MAAEAPQRKARVKLDETPETTALRAWRRERARSDGVPAFVVMHDSTLAVIAERRPRTQEELAEVPGIGPTKLGRYGDDLLAALAAVPAA
jgi:superfamily II DNA helicase RecQ